MPDIHIPNSPTLADLANYQLATLVELADTGDDALKVIEERVTKPQDLRNGWESVKARLAQTGQREMLGVFGGSTADARQATLARYDSDILYEVDGELWQQAMRKLKDTARIVQFGSGRGRALAIISDVPLLRSTRHPQPRDIDALVSNVVAAQQRLNEVYDELSTWAAENQPTP